ncbi:ROK family protein [Microbacterium sp. RD1]|uniref:ROK family protein n=1 Tax=Microbacterium sp. RD1 TaxID=3457313 RepID=UPI003FA57234
MTATLAIGIDVGGTTVKAVVADETGTVHAESRRPTVTPDPTGAGVVDTIARMLAELDEAARLPVGVVVPGIVDEVHGHAVQSANLGWCDLPLAALLEARLGRPVGFGHDVRAGALAEARWGAASDLSDVVAFVPVGTGIAAAVLVDGHPLVGGGWAGEIGQLRIASGPFAGMRVEEVASASGTARRAGSPDAKSVLSNVRDGDPAARKVWLETIDVLADALAGLTAGTGAATIIVGGGLALAGSELFEPLERALDARLGMLRRPALRPARLGDRAAALGAALLARGTT